MSSRSVNTVILLGRLGKDAETKFTSGGTAVTSFSIATDRRWKDKSGEWKTETNWTNVILWQAENLANYLTKGKQVYVNGRLQTRSYEKDGRKVYVTEVAAEDVILCGGESGAKAEPRTTNSGPRDEWGDHPLSPVTISDEDVPF